MDASESLNRIVHFKTLTKQVYIASLTACSKPTKALKSNDKSNLSSVKPSFVCYFSFKDKIIVKETLAGHLKPAGGSRVRHSTDVGLLMMTVIYYYHCSNGE